MSKEVQKQLFTKLRIYEHNAYAALLSAYKAQGELTWQKQRILDKVRETLYVEPDRHAAELIRTEQDPLLKTLLSQGIHAKRAQIFRLFTKTELRKNKEAPEDMKRAYDTDNEPKQFAGANKKKKKDKRRPRPKQDTLASYDNRPSKKPKTNNNVKRVAPEPIPRHPVYDLVDKFHSDEIDFSKETNRDRLESIANKEYEQQVILENKLKEFGQDAILTNFLYAEVKRKMDRISNLIIYVENLENSKPAAPAPATVPQAAPPATVPQAAPPATVPQAAPPAAVPPTAAPPAPTAAAPTTAPVAAP